MQKFLKKHRWSILAAGAAIQVLTGIPSAWGVFQKSVCQGYRLDEGDSAMIFSFVICFFGIGCVLGGLLQDKKGPRVAGIAGTVLLGAGFLSAGLWVPAQNPWVFYAAFSAPVGLGCAFLYPAVMSCAQKWYADKKGLATGVIGGAVGISGAVLTALGRWLIGMWGIRGAFCALGAGMLAVCGAACLLLENPKTSACSDTKAKNYTPGQMVKTRQYWLLVAVVALSTPAVLLFSPIIVELAQQRGLSEKAALSCIVVGSVCSAAGRLLMSWLSDKIGRRYTDMLLFAGLCGLSVWFWRAGGWWVLVVYSMLTFCYSGQAAVLPSAVTDLFGPRHTGVNYGFVALGMSAGSVGFPLAARLLHLTAGRHVIAIAAAGVGLVCLFFLKPTQGERL
ncbi:MFS transporter [uncultured Ruthenibacterium sp.]|uniref:MFS transporter n=1 Tax=uncultured Ruthenibacterium sp. TaxID=1905347 RepID=UPI00349EEAFE